MNLYQTIEKSLTEMSDEQLHTLLNGLRQSRTRGATKRKERSDNSLLANLVKLAKATGQDPRDILKQAGIELTEEDLNNGNL